MSVKEAKRSSFSARLIEMMGMDPEKTKTSDLLYKFRQPIILIVLCIYFALRVPGTFLTLDNLINVLYSVSLYGIMICGAMFPILLAGIDRTVSAVAAMSGAVCGMYIVQAGFTNGSVLLGVAAAVAVGMLIGAIHGIIVALLDIPAFLLTLATSEVIYGLIQVFTGKDLIVITKSELFTAIGMNRWLGVPIPVYILMVCFAISYVILNKTTYGRKVYYVGGNREAARLSGINVRLIYVTAYMMSGFMASIAGIVLASKTQQAASYAAQGYENDVLTAMVVGGVSLRGGFGTLQGAVFGAVLIGVLQNGLRLVGIDSTYHNLIKGIIIILAVAIDMFTTYRRSGQSRKGLLFRRGGKKEAARV